ncbi:MAG: BMP family ABC transporter substrate-binding protein [Streptosporangiales bacterium]|nr:BMP family ABC transporter substrate-binding protein [Streptosporangiales bacterium]
MAAAVCTAALVTAGAAACGGSESGSSGGGGEKTLKVGLAYDIGGRGDKSFNDSAYAGLQRVEKELNLEIKDLEAKDGETNADKVQRLDLLAKSGYNPIIAVGFVYTEAVTEVSKRHPDVKFGIVDSLVESPNVSSLLFAEHEASYLVGAAAALKSKTDTIGFVGGDHVPLIEKFEAGYMAGAKKVNPDIEVKVKYANEGSDGKGFKDPTSGKTIAQGQIDEGADVIYHASGLTGVGVIEAAAAKKKWAIGVDSDQYLTAPADQKPYVLTSALKRVDTAVFDFVKSVSDGTVKGGPTTFDLKNDGVGYSTANKEAIKDVQARLDELKKQIIDGEIKVPDKP